MKQRTTASGDVPVLPLCSSKKTICDNSQFFVCGRQAAQTWPDDQEKGRGTMKNVLNGLKKLANRRSFLKKGLAVGMGGGLLGTGRSLFGKKPHEDSKLTSGDAAILRFLAAAEILESDLWVQYNELGGVQDSEVPGITGG